MGKNTSISLGFHYETFIEERVANGRYQNTSEVIRAGLRLPEDEENRFIVLSNAISDGVNSEIALNFDPKQHLEELKAKKRIHG